MKSEEWRVVKGYSSYEVSNLGRVRVVKTGKLLKPDKTGVSTLGRVFLRNTEGRRTLGVSTLMRENWKWEWIKEIKEGEEFKEAVGFPGYYVSNKGRVFSLQTYNFLTATHTFSYYWVVNLGGRNSKNTPLHTLVGRTFLPWKGELILHTEETLPFPEINWVENLHLGTWSDNNRETWEKGRNTGNPLGNPYGRAGKPKGV